jgi:hypothetical protein
MTLAAVYQAIRERWATQVATPNELPTVYDNAPEPAKAAQWARLSVVIDSTTQVSMGLPVRFRSRGAAVVNLSTSAEKGDAALIALTDDVLDAFRGVSLSSPQVRFDSPTPIGSPTVDGAWFTRTVRIPFIADTYQTT